MNLGILSAFIRRNFVRGECQCGQCAAPAPDARPPAAPIHSADLVFFQISAVQSEISKPLVRETFLELVSPSWMDGNEHGYIEIGGDVGDQGLALTVMGAGAILGVWHLLTPLSILGSAISRDTGLRMAGSGMVTVTTGPHPVTGLLPGAHPEPSPVQP